METRRNINLTDDYVRSIFKPPMDSPRSFRQLLISILTFLESITDMISLWHSAGNAAFGLQATLAYVVQSALALNVHAQWGIVNMGTF
jgi:hypothetical protein